MTHTLFAPHVCKAFRVSSHGSTLLVAPVGDLEDYRYQDVHNDIGRILDLLLLSEFNHLVVDLEHRLFRGAVLTDALVSFARATRGRAILVDVSDAMASRLASLKLLSLFQVIDDFEVAVEHA
jgi:hypothetical protein